MTGASMVYMDLLPPYVLLEDLLVLDDLLADASPPLLSGKPHPLFGGLLPLEEDERDDLSLRSSTTESRAALKGVNQSWPEAPMGWP